MSKSTLKILPALIIAITAALVTQPMRAGTIDTLVITENSSTSLTALLNGTTSLNVTFNSADNWTIDLAGVGVKEGQQFWQEPETAERIFNFVTTDLGGPGGQQPNLNVLFVTSEQGCPSCAGVADGTADTTNFALNGNPLFVTFFDKGDVATVPDTGTTFSLFGVSLMGLGFLRRKLC